MHIAAETPYVRPPDASRLLALATPADEPGGRDAGAAEKAGGSGEFSFFGDDGFTFDDVLDIVNPLQHLPVISTMYREMTGDELAAGPRMMGSTLFFGPLGLAGAVANVMVEEQTGKDIGAHVASWVLPEGSVGDDATAVADAGGDADALAAFPTAAGGQGGSGDGAADPAFGADDPVSAWARGELAWAERNQAAMNQDGFELSTRAPGAGLPDANDVLLGQAQIASAADAVRLTDDVRSANRAYQAALGLRLDS